MKLSNILVILDEKRYGENENQITTSGGGKLKVKKARFESSFQMSGPCFLTYLIAVVITPCNVPQDVVVRLCDVFAQRRVGYALVYT